MSNIHKETGVSVTDGADKWEFQKELQETWENLDISNDYMFGKAMKDVELCKELLHRILPDLDIERIEYPELQKAISPNIAAKSIRLDVYVRDGKAVKNSI